MDRGGQHHTRGEAGGEGDGNRGAVAGPRPGQQVDGAQGQERDVEDGSEQVEGSEDGAAPSVGGAEPQEEGPEHEQAEGHRPRQVVAPAAVPPALERGQRERQRDQGRGGRERDLYRHAPERTSAHVPL